MTAINQRLRRVKSLKKYIGLNSWSFILFGDAPIPPEKAALIRPGDAVYVRRIGLTHDAQDQI